MDYRQNSNRCWYEDVCSNYTKTCKESCIRFEEMMYLVKNSGLPKPKWYPGELYAGEDYKQFMRLVTIKCQILEFVEQGNNLYITSKYTGNGKTSWSIKLLLRYFNEVWAGNGFRIRGMFIHVPTLLLQLKNFSNPLSEEYKQNILNCDLVVWDEIGFISISDYDYSNLLMFLENRILSGKSNIFTGNCDTKEKLSEVVGFKLASRIWETSEIIKFEGKDRR